MDVFGGSRILVHRIFFLSIRFFLLFETDYRDKIFGTASHDTKIYSENKTSRVKFWNFSTQMFFFMFKKREFTWRVFGFGFSWCGKKISCCPWSRRPSGKRFLGQRRQNTRGVFFFGFYLFPQIHWLWWSFTRMKKLPFRVWRICWSVLNIFFFHFFPVNRFQ